MHDPKYVMRPWGEFLVYAENEPCTVKALFISPFSALSLQMHNHRAQRYIIISKMQLEWSDMPVPIELDNPKDILEWYKKHTIRATLSRGEERYFAPRVIHRATNLAAREVMFFEVAFGENDEADIIRLDDRYGRAQRGNE